MVEIIIAAVVAIVVGFLIGYFLMQKVLKERNDATALEAQNALADAQREAESMKREALVEAKDEVLKMKQDAEPREQGTYEGCAFQRKSPQSTRAEP